MKLTFASPVGWCCCIPPSYSVQKSQREPSLFSGELEGTISPKQAKSPPPLLCRSMRSCDLKCSTRSVIMAVLRCALVFVLLMLLVAAAAVGCVTSVPIILGEFYLAHLSSLTESMLNDIVAGVTTIYPLHPRRLCSSALARTRMSVTPMTVAVAMAMASRRPAAAAGKFQLPLQFFGAPSIVAHELTNVGDAVKIEVQFLDLAHDVMVSLNLGFGIVNQITGAVVDVHGYNLRLLRQVLKPLLDRLHDPVKVATQGGKGRTVKH